jgi:hypothetical protein
LAYYLRAFCTSDEIPPLRVVFEWVGGRGVRLEAPATDLDASGWEQAEVIYRPDRQPFIAERCVGDLLREEIEEFTEFLEEVDESPERQDVLDHLERSKAVVAAQLLSDIDDDGYNAVGAFLSYYVEQCGGLIQADGEGFYRGEQVIVELD